MVSKWGKRCVSKTESALSTFGFLYTLLGLYMVTNMIIFLRAAVEEAGHHRDFQRYVTAISRGCGATINLNMAIVLLVASRSFVGFLRETPLTLVLPLDKVMPDFHRIVGILVVLAGVTHSTTHWVTYLLKRPWSGGYNGMTSLFITGMILLALLVAIRVAARTTVYKSNYEAFHRIHVGGSVLAFVTIIIHGLHRGTPSTWKWVLAPVIIYVLDLGIRSFRERKSYLLVSKHSAVFQGPDILKIKLPRVFHFIAGQYAELKVPELSRLQWHPFTIASAPHESEIVFYIKAVGDWTISMYRLFSERIRERGNDIEVHIRGPFGAPAQHVGQFDRVIVIGGGVGATPFCSVVKDAHHWMTNWTPQNRRLNMNGKGGNTRRRGNMNDYERRSNQRYDSQKSWEGRKDGESGFISDMGNSHIFTTNVYSEPLDLHDRRMEEDVLDSRKKGMSETNDARSNLELGQAVDDARVVNSIGTTTVAASSIAKAIESIDVTAAATSSAYTARHYLCEALEASSSGSTQGSSENHSMRNVKSAHRKRFDPSHDDLSIEPHIDGRTWTETSPRKNTKRSGKRPREVEDEGMGSYQANSTGSTRQSLDYMGALHSAYLFQETNEIYQKGLDMMVSLNFGSASLVRTMQMRQTQRSIRQNTRESLPYTANDKNLNILHNPRVMFLLFMRSVTVNMILLWILLTRFVVAATAFVFGGLRIFERGIALYTTPVLTVVDLILVLGMTILIGVPSVLEIIELGAAPVHGLDLFVLTPTAIIGVVADILALTNVGTGVELFGVVHIFVLWPILTILVMIRLLRIVGERISQAESIMRTHSNTKAVDFYWTAPTPDDDRWLVNELTPYSTLDSVQLHRYLTRCKTSKKTRLSKTRKLTPSLHTNYGRPNWDQIFNETAETSMNNSTIGVFFCGPASMGEAVQKACMEAMRNSIVRGLQCGAQAMRGLEAVFGEAVSANAYTGEMLPEYGGAGHCGCNVKFVFKRETFA